MKKKNADFLKYSEQRLEELNNRGAIYEKQKANAVKGQIVPVPAELTVMSDAFKSLIKGTDFMVNWNAENYKEAIMSLDEEVRIAAFSELRFMVPDSFRSEVIGLVVENRSEERPVPDWMLEDNLESIPPDKAS